MDEQTSASETQVVVDTRSLRKKEILIISILDLYKDCESRHAWLGRHSPIRTGYRLRTENELRSKTLDELKKIKKRCKNIQYNLMSTELEWTPCLCYFESSELEYWFRYCWNNAKKAGSRIVDRIFQRKK